MSQLRRVASDPMVTDFSADYSENQQSLGSQSKVVKIISPLNLFSGETLDISTKAACSSASRIHSDSKDKSRRVSLNISDYSKTTTKSFEQNDEQQIKRDALTEYSGSRLNALNATNAGSIRPVSQSKTPGTGQRQISKQSNQGFNWEPYEYLKLCDDMEQFYDGIQNQSFRTNSKEFQQKVRLLQIKLRGVDLLIESEDHSEFSFVLRDFMGHFTALIESTDTWKWILPFILPFMKNVQRSNVSPDFVVNSAAAFKDICLIIRGISAVRAKHMKHTLLGHIWTRLSAILTSDQPDIVEASFYVLLEITAYCEPSSALLECVVRLRQQTGIASADYFSTGFLRLRQLHAEIYQCFLLSLDSQSKEHKVLKQLCLGELSLWFDREQDTDLTASIRKTMNRFSNGISYRGIPAYSPLGVVNMASSSTTLSPRSPVKLERHPVSNSMYSHTYNGYSRRPNMGLDHFGNSWTPSLQYKSPVVILGSPLTVEDDARATLKSYRWRSAQAQLSRGRAAGKTLVNYYAERIRDRLAFRRRAD